jgi:flavin-dependent dehydrogenase
MKRHLAGSPERLGGRVELHVFRGGYAGLGAIEADRLNLCLLTMVGALRASGGSPDRLLDERVRRNPAARAALDGIEPAGPWKTMGPLRFGARLPSAAGALFVGDAAGTVDPFCGEGMSNALRAAELALPAALEALARGRLEPDAAARYDRAWRAAFGPMTRRARALGWVLERPRISTAALGLLARGGGGLFRRVVAATRPGARRP